MVQDKFRKGIIATWLLPVVLVLSLFSFSGINGPSATKHSTATTEQIDVFRVSHKRCASFKIVTTESPSQPDNFTIRFQQIVLSLTRANKVQTEQFNEHRLNFITLNPSVAQYSPRGSVEDSFISFIG